MLLYHTEILSFNCDLSVAKYQHRDRYQPKTALSINLYLKHNQTWLVA